VQHVRVPLNVNTFSTEEIDAAINVLKSGDLTMGRRSAEFERAFADYMGGGEAVFVNSGSSANLLVFFALANPKVPVHEGRRRRLERGDEVIVPAVTWSTTVWPIVQAACVPVLVDCDPHTFQISAAAVEAAIGPKTKAICPVHVLGNAAPLPPLKALAARHGLWLIEDTCEALGAVHRNIRAGRFGHVSTFSFFFSHHMSTVEGGMALTEDPELADLLRCLRAHGWTRQLRSRERVEREYPDLDNRFLFINTGFNVRPTEIAAAFGLEQLKKLDGFNARRIAMAARWDEALASLADSGFLRPMRPTEDTICPRFGYPVMCMSKEVRDGLRSHLERNGIETRPIICGNLARQPAMRMIEHRVVGSLCGAEAIMDRGLLWGLHPMLTHEQLDYVSKTVHAFFQQ
jgi:CDP-6-deoxy-D-xylo-4-hexulose-3-dehydrase